MSLVWRSSRGEPLHGVLAVPGDKSISHRALMLAAIADGDSRIRGFLEGGDTRATACILAQLGVAIETPLAGERIVHGVGLHGLRASPRTLDCGNSGTGMRLLAGLLAGQDFASSLSGDSSLATRPMRRVIEPLARMGAHIGSRQGLPPLHIDGRPLTGCRHAPEVASAQVKSALLLAGLYARGATSVTELRPTRDYTERMLATFGWPIDYAPGHVRLQGGYRLQAADIDVPADFSSAAFFLVAASIVPGSRLRLNAVGLNPRRTGLLQALRLMGADIRVEGLHGGAEPVGDLLVRHAPLHGINLPTTLVPDMIDELPALFVAAAVATGTTRVRGAAELRVKESDRLASMAGGLRILGAVVEESADGATICGGRLTGGRIDSHLDHRVAMSFAVAGLVAADAVEIAGSDCVATSFPGFRTLANGCGFHLDEAVQQP